MEKFSVLMSVYHKERAEHFDLALESNLLTQTLPPNEFVLVCDGALTPELEDIIRKYQELAPQVLKVYRKENEGLGKALNFGLTKCAHQLIARSDSDDICLPDRFEKQVHFMQQHPEYIVTSGTIAEFVEDHTQILRIKTNPTTPTAAYNKCKYANPLNHMAVMFRKDIIQSLGSYHDVPLLEDYNLWARVLIAGYQVCNLPDILVKARIGNGMVERRGRKSLIREWKTIGQNMLRHHMINRATYIFDYIIRTTFVYSPAWVKNILYATILRQRP